MPILQRAWEDEVYGAGLSSHSRNLEQMADELCYLYQVRTSKSGFPVEKETQLVKGGTTKQMFFAARN